MVKIKKAKANSNPPNISSNTPKTGNIVILKHTAIFKISKNSSIIILSVSTNKNKKERFKKKKLIHKIRIKLIK